MRVFVTGGCGYIGTILVEKLIRLGHTVDVVDTMWFGNFLTPHNNLNVEQKDVRTITEFPEGVYDAIIHLAAVANDPSADLNPKLSWEVNALSTMRLADAAVRAGVEQFILASSGSVYGLKEEPKVTEDLTLVPLTEYNKTKMVAERVVLSYKDKMAVTCLRPATVCGFSPRMRFDVVVNMFTIQALEKGKITIFGGAQTRPHIHMRDMVDLYLFCLDNRNRVSGEIFNAGFENINLVDLANLVKQIVEGWGIRKVEIEVQESTDPRSYNLDATKIKEVGFVPSCTVADGVEDLLFQYRHLKLESKDDNYNVRWMQKCDIK